MTLPGRRWLRFSLRGLLAAVTLVCLWLGWNVERKRRQQELISAIHELGGEVVYERPPGDWTDLLLGPAAPVEVNLLSRSATDEIAAKLQELRKLRTLRMRGAYITDAGAASLGKITSLETLELFYPFITDEGLAHLSRLNGLRKLTIANTQFSDDAVDGVQALQNLKELALERKTHR